MKTLLSICILVLIALIIWRMYITIGHIIADLIDKLCVYAEVDPLDEESYEMAIYVWPLCVIAAIFYFVYTVGCIIYHFLFP